MEQLTAQLSSKYQMVIPLKLRKVFGLKKGSKIYLQQIGEGEAILSLAPMDSVKLMAGLGKDVWERLGGVEAYLKTERESWPK